MKLCGRAILPTLFTVLACVSCATPSARVSGGVIPLGPGVEHKTGVAGTGNHSPALAAQGQFVALAWLSAIDQGNDVYIAASEDGGLTFSPPHQLNEERDRASADPSLRVTMTVPPDRSMNELRWPDIHVEWTAIISGRQAMRSSGERFSFVREAPPIHSADGPSMDWWQMRPADRSLTNLVDWREWVHVVRANPAGGAEPAHLSYSSSTVPSFPIREFGPSQTLESPGATPARPVLVVDNNSTIVIAWDEVDSQGHRAMLRQIIPRKVGAGLVLPMIRLSGKDSGTSPALATIPGGVLAAWTSGESGGSLIALRTVGLDAVCTTDGPAPLAVTPR